MNKQRVEETAKFMLSDLYSFLKVGDIWESHERDIEVEQLGNFIQSSVSGFPSEKLIGVYVNSLDNLDFLVITDAGLHKVFSGEETFMSYDTIQSVDLPSAEDRFINIKQKSGDSVELPVCGTTEGLSDASAVHEFLKLLFREALEPQVKLNNVENIHDLKAFLRQNLNDEENLEGMNQWLSRDLRRWIQKADIDPDIFDQRGIWRLLALALVLPQRTRWKGRR